MIDDSWQDGIHRLRTFGNGGWVGRPRFLQENGSQFSMQRGALDLGLEDCSVLEWDRSSLDFFSALASFFLSFISADIRASAQHGKSRIV